MNRKDRRLAAKSGRAATPLVPAAHQRARDEHRLAEALRRDGRPRDAEPHYRRAAMLMPAAETLINLGNVLLELGRPAEALDAYHAATAQDPTVPAAHFGLGCALAALGQPPVAAFAHAVALAPTFTAAHEALVAAYLAAGAEEAGCRAACHALLHVDSPPLRAGFANSVTQILPDDGTPGLRQAMRRALTERWKRPPDLARAVCTLVARRQPVDVDDSLLRALLIAAPVCHRALEATLTAERHRLLQAAESLSPKDLSRACALARQGWINEYAWSVAPAEADRLAALRDELQAALDRDAPPLALAVVLAMYQPLGTLANAAALLAHRAPPDIAAVLAQQLTEPAAASRLRAAIPAMPAIAGDISLAVRDQYEENPYPRWIALPAVAQRMPYATFLAQRFPTAAKLPNRTLELLVAGCGTGQHPLELLNAYTDIDVLAIDLSLASLAYAARMAELANLRDIAFHQADLLRIAELDRTFDIIESAGVLHHMADLWAGWRALLGVLRPGGVMAVSLYSKRARVDVMRARDWIAAHDFPATPDGIRACRQALFAVPDPWARNLTASADFATISGCRDLLFHVHETAVTMPELTAFLDAEHLTLLGVETPPAIASAFRAWAGNDDAIRDLARWDRYESEHPDCFASMIHLWVQKAKQA